MTPTFSIRGVEHRARELKGAANRLRWEIDYVLGVVPGGVEEMSAYQESDLTNAMYQLSEAMGVLKNAMDTLESQVKNESLRERMMRIFNNQYEFYKGFHRIAR